jgi:exodeoxyribonuclease-5
MIELGKEQQEALDFIINFIKESENIAFSLEGPAGTGKTTILNYLLDWMEDEGIVYALCAPTHKAALVMKQITKRHSNTLHSLLALSPNIDILDLDLRELQFKTSKVQNNIPNRGIVICDEASMINDDLFDLLIEKVSIRETKIIFIGDSAQLLPVKQVKHSKVYKLKDNYKLTKIYRQSEKNSIGPILQELRSNEISNFITCKGEEGSLIVDSDMKLFFEKALKEIEIAINSKNILHTKIAAYTNSRVHLYNEAVRKYLFNNTNEYNIGDILTAYENGEYQGLEYYNSMDYIVIDNVVECIKDLPHFGQIKGFNIKLWDPFFESKFEIFILSKDNPQMIFDNLAYTIEHIRLQAIDAKKRKLKTSYKYWRMYYDLIHSFASPIDLFFDGRVIRKKSFDYGYAMTVHRLQGSTYNNIFVDMRNIKTCKDDLVRRQLQYVALSRTRGNAYILQ